MSTTDPSPAAGTRDWQAIEVEPDFQELRRRLRSFVFPVTGLFLGWYVLYVLLATYAAPFMSIKVLGNINLGLLLGLLQFVSTFAITAWYVKFADRRLDPLSSKIREEIQGADK